MNIIEEIRAALLLATPNDLDMYLRYLQWMMVRRKINDRFFFRAHWIQGPKKVYHWL